jgi:hypothetical protein
MNLVAAPLGGVPMCRGAGGMAGHVRFGARTGGALVILGVLLTVGALFFADSVATVFRLFPVPVLGVILFFSGIELAVGLNGTPFLAASALCWSSLRASPCGTWGWRTWPDCCSTMQHSEASFASDPGRNRRIPLKRKPRATSRGASTETLRRVPYFASLPTAELSHLAGRCTVRSLGCGDFLRRE